MMLHEVHVEDVMEAGALWKFQSVGRQPDAPQHLERHGVSRLQLPFGVGI